MTKEELKSYLLENLAIDAYKYNYGSNDVIICLMLEGKEISRLYVDIPANKDE